MFRYEMFDTPIVESLRLLDDGWEEYDANSANCWEMRRREVVAITIGVWYGMVYGTILHCEFGRPGMVPVVTALAGRLLRGTNAVGGLVFGASLYLHDRANRINACRVVKQERARVTLRRRIQRTI